MRTLRILLLFCAAAFLTSVAFTPASDAQVSFGINIGGGPPVCPYGYYGYAPYRCAPAGYYGPGYFYNGIFLGVGPWANWGYGHGWGAHRFIGARGGHYRGEYDYGRYHGPRYNEHGQYNNHRGYQNRGYANHHENGGGGHPESHGGDHASAHSDHNGGDHGHGNEHH